MTPSSQPAQRDRLNAIRRRIDRLDDRLVLLLKLRSELVEQAQDIKKLIGLPARSPERELEIFARCRASAERYRLNPAATSRIVSAVLQNSLQMAGSVDTGQVEHLADMHPGIEDAEPG